MLFHDVEVDGDRVDVRVDGGVVTFVGSDRQCWEPGIDGRGCALLPGLHDHHLHLMATSAALRSAAAGPPGVIDAGQLQASLASATPAGGWVRAVGYDESVAGPLDRWALDRLHPDLPVRVQHRSGALWIVNSPGAEVLGLDSATHEGIERDAQRRPTGRLWRADDWLSDRLGHQQPPDLRPVGRALAVAGVTGVTDATPTMGLRTAELLAAAHRHGDLPQRITLLAADLVAAPAGLTMGPSKIMVTDHALPGFDDLRQQVVWARARGRPVAVHCVTREALVLTLAVLTDVGTLAGDRIEHAAVAPPEAIELAAGLGVAVVTQPSLVALRGDDYLERVEPGDADWLWPWASLARAGIPVAGSSDAPYGDLDPWFGIRSAVARRGRTGRAIGEAERVTAACALDGWLSAADDPGGPARRIRPGLPGDLVLLDAPLSQVLAGPAKERVRLTVIAGSVVYDAATEGGP